MIKLINLNIVREVETEEQAQALIALGFERMGDRSGDNGAEKETKPEQSEEAASEEEPLPEEDETAKPGKKGRKKDDRKD